ncbi:MAG: hypothetical protein KBT20_11060 [Bacteroidales bacterium]|nr:hypothetical protein [Candidatus Liminaster caballi]
MADFFIKRADVDVEKILRERGLDPNGEVQKFIDSECLRLCDPLVPFDQGTLKESGVINTVVGSGEIKYRTPYARRWYYMPANFQGAPDRGNYWFDRMKNNGGKDQILRGAAKLAGGSTS